jgi:HEPN domain-containing protein
MLYNKKMEEIYNRWLRQAEADYDSANYNLSGKRYYVCANYSQQTVEKALKALLIFKKKDLVKTHGITSLAKKLKAPEKLIFKIASLEPIFRESKYPDISEKIPADEYEESDAIEFLNIAEEVLV